jgi:hypothetical protein
MKKYLIAASLFLFMAAAALAQDEGEAPEKKGFDKSKLFFGGNILFIPVTVTGFYRPSIKNNLGWLV